MLRRMDETGCDLFLDIHGDEEIAANFLAGSEGIPSFNEPMGALAKTFLRRCFLAKLETVVSSTLPWGWSCGDHSCPLTFSPDRC